MQGSLFPLKEINIVVDKIRKVEIGRHKRMNQ